MNSPATKPLVRLSWGFRGSQTRTCRVAVAEVWVSPPRPSQACLAAILSSLGGDNQPNRPLDPLLPGRLRL